MWVRVFAEVPALKFGVGANGSTIYSDAWYGDDLLYIAHGDSPGQCGPAMFIPNAGLPRPLHPRQATDRPTLSATWGPEGSWGVGQDGKRALTRTLAFTAFRDGHVSVYMKRMDSGDVADLLPGDYAAKTGGLKKVHGWISPDLLSFEGVVGPSVRRLFLVDTPRRKLIATPPLDADKFQWQMNRVAGQRVKPSYSFWLWDRLEGRFLNPKSLPGDQQFFETWDTGEGRVALFTSWPKPQVPYATSSGTPALFRLDVDEGRFEKIADRAGLAAWTWSGSYYLAYVRIAERLTLVLADGVSGRTFWEEDLGVPQPGDDLQQYRPVFAGNFLFFRIAGNGLRVKQIKGNRATTLHAGPLNTYRVRVGGDTVVLLADGRLAVIPNPLWWLQTECPGC